MFGELKTKKVTKNLIVHYNIDWIVLFDGILLGYLRLLAGNTSRCSAIEW